MNDESPLTAEQLAQATSRALPPGAALDPQKTASLREGYLHFGRSVEAANREFDEAAFLSKLTAATETTLRPNKNWWPLVLTAALAASALVAIVRTVAVWPAPQKEVVTAPQLPSTPESPAGATDSISQLAWSDPLDEEIASAQDAVGRLGGGPADLDGSLMSFGSRLEALAAELESGSL